MANQRERNDAQIVVRIPTALRDEIAELAAEQERSEAQIVRMAIRHYLTAA